MDVQQAIQARHSVRDFLSRPIPKDIVMKIMEVATHSPSGGNSQPWQIFVASGATMENIRKAYQERMQSGAGGKGGPGSPGVPSLPEFVQERMATIRNERMKLLGLDPADPASD